ncbi:MAG: gamma-glutamyl-gamma-aminobutyrate hydrolase family protein [Alphaproteobacteria bacterium]|nr:gamma-glutamyl-gamma-aminobutyrate hydrolase family protein [Alphaproteobacteria bacterium]MBF0129985.1 gamma-glutamyl-gamma-aminobutyrate hydrolase family protein [Alphaproteobacteria bacterium]
MSRHPVIGVSACVKPVPGEDLPFHAAPELYLTAVVECSGGLPFMIPALGHLLNVDEVVEHLDGLLLTGSKSNVHPTHYGDEISRPGLLHDEDRDATTVPLIRACIRMGIPLLAICRGIQELNVALGGTLYQRVQEEPDKMDHRAKPEDSVDRQFGPAHAVELVPGGLLARLCGCDKVRVNSLHGQGIRQLAPGLVVEARAPDGLIEAVRVDASASLAVGVQWHPEWNWREDALSRSLFTAFGNDCRAYAAKKTTRSTA